MSLNRRKALQWITFIAKVGVFLPLSTNRDDSLRFGVPNWSPRLNTKLSPDLSSTILIRFTVHTMHKLIGSIQWDTTRKRRSSIHLVTYVRCFGLHSRTSEKSNNFYKKTASKRDVTDRTTENANNETKTRTGSERKDDPTAQHTCRSVKSRQWEDENGKSLNDDDLLKRFTAERMYSMFKDTLQNCSLTQFE